MLSKHAFTHSACGFHGYFERGTEGAGSAPERFISTILSRGNIIGLPPYSVVKTVSFVPTISVPFEVLGSSIKLWSTLFTFLGLRPPSYQFSIILPLTPRGLRNSKWAVVCFGHEISVYSVASPLILYGSPSSNAEYEASSIWHAMSPPAPVP